ncbi:MAG: DegT/DnrJ/EryC1/StrS family aminotransferase [Opitutales bacterium]|nr:DegT/DnrJ/EryC1/StrS family aminotransferase [Opitutales bacterium]
MNKKIWLSLAHMGGHEQDFIKEAFDTNWVVPLGPNVNAFEAGLSAYLGENRHVVALSAGTDKEALDFYVFHQANNFINSYLAKKLKLDAKKIPSCVEKFGNTSSVSVPLTIASELRERMCGERKLLLSAFGVGMTWATAVVPFVDCKVSELVEV